MDNINIIYQKILKSYDINIIYIRDKIKYKLKSKIKHKYIEYLKQRKCGWELDSNIISTKIYDYIYLYQYKYNKEILLKELN